MKFLFPTLLALSFLLSIKGQDISTSYTSARDDKQSDSVRMDAYRAIVNNYLVNGKTDSLKAIFNESLVVARKSKDPVHYALCYNFLGLYYDFSTQRNYDSSLICYQTAINHIKNEPAQRIHAVLYNNLALIYQRISQLDSLKHFAEIGYLYADTIDDYQLKNMTLQRLSDYYRITGNYSKALECDNKTIELARNQGDTTRLILSLFQMGSTNIEANKLEEGAKILKGILTDFDSSRLGPYLQIINTNIGVAYIEQENYIEGLKYTFKAVNPDKKDISYYITLSNIAESYLKLIEEGYPDAEIPRFQQLNQLEVANNPQKTIEEIAVDYCIESINGFEQLNNDRYQVYPLSGLATYHKNKNNPSQALNYYQQAYNIAERNDLLTEQNEMSLELYELSKSLNKTKEALQWHEIYVTTKDSLNSKENQQEIGRQLAQFEFSNIRLKDSLEQIKKDAIQQLQIEQQNQNIKNERLKKYYLYGGLVITLFLLLFLFRRFNITQKQKRLIELQKAAMEEKQIELSKTHLAIKDSINYSRKIQKAIFPSKAEITSIFPNNFVLFKPKDIVSGDFYWCYEANNKKVIVLGDCTGHGVPGAFMTIIGINILKEILHDNVFESAEILKAVNHKLKNRLNQNNDSINDGMDLGVCVIDEQMIEFSGAHFPLYHISDNQLIEYKGSNIFLGNENETGPIKTHYIPYKKGDHIYLVTDGFPDQRGGEKGKKYYYKPLRDLLIKNVATSLDQQKMLLQTEFENWIKEGNKGQMDDVSIIGIKF